MNILEMLIPLSTTVQKVAWLPNPHRSRVWNIVREAGLDKERSWIVRQLQPRLWLTRWEALKLGLLSAIVPHGGLCTLALASVWNWAAPREGASLWVSQSSAEGDAESGSQLWATGSPADIGRCCWLLRQCEQ